MKKWVKKLRDALDVDLGSEKKEEKKPQKKIKNSEDKENKEPSSTTSNISDLKNVGSLGTLVKQTFTELLDSDVIQNIEIQLEDSLQSERVKHPDVQLVEPVIEQRAEQYKLNHKVQYETMVMETLKLYKRLAAGEKVSYSQIKAKVQAFFETLIQDKHFLLNLTTARAKSLTDKSLYYHVVNTCLMAMSIPTTLGFSKEEIIEIGVAAMLADVGMELVPHEVQNKSGKLNNEDLFEIQKHPIYTCNILESIDKIPANVVLGAYQHHERESGSGYPKQRKSHLIHEYAQIISAVDVYEALTSYRPHRNPQEPYNAMRTLLDQTKHGFLNKEKVKSFLEHFGLFPIGSLVKITNGEVAKVVASHKEDVTKPVVAVLTTEDQSLLDKSEIYFKDLLKEKDEKIISPVNENDFESTLMMGF